jgi:rhodanese-related sulfurtransferase
MKEITVKELKQMMDEGRDFQLIDVREVKEYDFANIGGELMPLGQILDFTEQIARDKPVIVHCRSGARSAQAIMQLEQSEDFNNLYNLKGGILAWADEIDTSIPKY